MKFFQWLKSLFAAKPKPVHNRRYVSHMIEVCQRVDQDWNVGRAGTTLLVCGRASEVDHLAEYLKGQGKTVVVKNGRDLSNAQHVVEAAGIHDQVYIIGHKGILSTGWALRSDHEVRIYSCCVLGRDYKTQLMGRWFKNGVRTAPVDQYVPQ